jgi:uncharacterized protein
VKVKVGPITAQYKGTARLAEVDEEARRIVIDASGRDTRGQGNASAKIVVTMSGDDAGTEVAVDTDLSITGKVAQFGRGVLGDVSAKLLGQFVERLEADVLSGDHATDPPTEPAPAVSTPAAEPTSNDDDAPAPTASTTAVPTTPAPAAPRSEGARRVEGPEVEPVDLLATAGAPVGRRLVPVVIGAIVAFLLFRRWRHRG